MKINQFVFIFVLVSGILVGAAISSVVMTSESYVSRKTSVKSVYDSRFKSFEYHGHRYLKYMDIVQAYSTTLHDPDCPCWTNRLETLR